LRAGPRISTLSEEYAEPVFSHPTRQLAQTYRVNGIKAHTASELRALGFVMDLTTILIVLLIVLLLGGGGVYWGRGRRRP
jgi:hypothetical protein